MALNVTATKAPVNAELLIGGEWITSAERVEVYNPARPAELVGSVVRGTPADVERAIAAARAAQPPWAARGIRERATLLAHAINALERDVDARAHLHVRENGKTLTEARDELLNVPRRMRPVLEYVDALDAPHETERDGIETKVIYRPFGVVASIVPWNSPVTLAFDQIVPALLAGNTVVVKPPETSPLVPIASIALFVEHLPPGVLNVVTGLPAEIGDALTLSPHVDKLVFTGSIRSARLIGANAVQTIKSFMLELGGNDAAILLDDAELDDATMRRMAGATFYHAGQVCMNIKRIFVPERIAPAFIDAFRRVVDEIVVGDGLQPGVTMGPLHTRAALDRTRALIDDARARGATLDECGRLDTQSAQDSGHFVRPTLVSNLPLDAPLMTEEQFCPVLPIATYAKLEDAIAWANDTEYGLGGSVWSRDLSLAAHVAEQLEAGSVFVNAHGTRYTDRHSAYGGMKQSGVGRKAGLEGIREYMESQVVRRFAPAAFA